mmetsp:Transcript_10394/g.20807  ORF Transcript_10394/g.20807 Transcript_10394/m.20807 type:complete len:222 (-) Transcript_10394:243-908(-)
MLHSLLDVLRGEPQVICKFTFLHLRHILKLVGEFGSSKCTWSGIRRTVLCFLVELAEGLEVCMSSLSDLLCLLENKLLQTFLVKLHNLIHHILKLPFAVPDLRLGHCVDNNPAKLHSVESLSHLLALKMDHSRLREVLKRDSVVSVHIEVLEKLLPFSVSPLFAKHLHCIVFLVLLRRALQFFEVDRIGLVSVHPKEKISQLMATPSHHEPLCHSCFRLPA